LRLKGKGFIVGALAGAAMGLIIVACAGCATLRGPGPTVPAPVVQVVKECHQTVEANFVEIVNATAAGDEWLSGLESLVKASSLCAVRVAAEQLIQEYAGIKMEPSNVDVPGRLKVWLQDHPNTGATQ
jgi:hypothetical protein